MMRCNAAGSDAGASRQALQLGLSVNVDALNDPTKW
jgi:hypothetical protein